jgi:hypothetical protein
MDKSKYNPELEEGDRVICIQMNDDFPITTGMKGTVMGVSEVFGDKIYYVNWDNGSRLSLVEGADKWMKESQSRKSRVFSTNETVIKKKNFLNENFYEQNRELFRYFNHGLLHRYLKALRSSSITNMFGARPYLYMGRERIEHEHHYDNIHNEEEYEKVLEMADEVRDEMIRGSMKYLQEKGEEVNLKKVSKAVDEFSKKMIVAYFKIAGGRIP